MRKPKMLIDPQSRTGGRMAFGSLAPDPISPPATSAALISCDRRVVAAGAAAVRSVADAVDKTFVQAVRALDCSGTILLTGNGTFRHHRSPSRARRCHT